MTVAEPEFAAEPEVVTCHGLLFDMDGTIIDSTEAVVKNWQKIGRQIGVDPEVILATSHGRRSIDVLQIYEPKLANWDYIREVEGVLPKEFGADAVEIPGSRALLEQIDQRSIPWCIVTSGTRPLVTGWLDVLNLAHPQNLVTAEDVKIGKPDPACYALGASKLKLPKANPSILVFEDAPAGVRSGKAAGFRVVGLATTHSIEELIDAGADWIVRDMTSVRLEDWDETTGEARIAIHNALTRSKN
ncbi:HAD-like protein [Westerdykella ornata]|uniref:HAD-like protein n=1 Tax=Westerdykella ornata TaxID=318751 RepID=A0A6A6JJE0_WESOR|nr:HAD-like protein [Westerdykella ornata]KAF2276253.1 HAD-like protein [Westerdykella ornata]